MLQGKCRGNNPLLCPQHQNKSKFQANKRVQSKKQRPETGEKQTQTGMCTPILVTATESCQVSPMSHSPESKSGSSVFCCGRWQPFTGFKSVLCRGHSPEQQLDHSDSSVQSLQPAGTQQTSRCQEAGTAGGHHQDQCSSAALNWNFQLGF